MQNKTKQSVRQKTHVVLVADALGLADIAVALKTCMGDEVEEAVRVQLIRGRYGSSRIW